MSNETVMDKWNLQLKRNVTLNIENINPSCFRSSQSIGFRKRRVPSNFSELFFLMISSQKKL